MFREPFPPFMHTSCIVVSPMAPSRRNIWGWSPRWTVVEAEDRPRTGLRCSSTFRAGRVLLPRLMPFPQYYSLLRVYCFRVVQQHRRRRHVVAALVDRCNHLPLKGDVLLKLPHLSFGFPKSPLQGRPVYSGILQPKSPLGSARRVDERLRELTGFRVRERSFLVRPLRSCPRAIRVPSSRREPMPHPTPPYYRRKSPPAAPDPRTGSAPAPSPSLRQRSRWRAGRAAETRRRDQS
jgi:hypothetical protein